LSAERDSLTVAIILNKDTGLIGLGKQLKETIRVL
jgi:hypothetical protein